MTVAVGPSGVPPVVGIVGSQGAFGSWLTRFLRERMGVQVIGHDLDLTVTGRILSGNPAIYEDIQFGNPHVLPMLGRLSDAVAMLRAQVAHGGDARAR